MGRPSNGLGRPSRPLIESVHRATTFSPPRDGQAKGDYFFFAFFAVFFAVFFAFFAAFFAAMIL